MAYIEKIIIYDFDNLLNENATNDKLLEYIYSIECLLHISQPTLKYFLGKVTDPDISLIFPKVCGGNCTENLQFLVVEYGANIYDIGTMLYAIRYDRLENIKFLVENGFKVYDHNDEIMLMSVLHEEIFSYFLDLGLVITDNIIDYHINNIKVLQMFLDKGVDPERIAQSCWRNLIKDTNPRTYVLKKMVMLDKYGVNINKSINQYLQE